MKKKIAILITTIIVIVTLAILIFNLVTGPKVNLLLQQETEAENLWKSKGITNYSIEVQFTPITPYEKAQIHRVTVKNQAVVNYEKFCIKSPFEFGTSATCYLIDRDPETFTVQGLFLNAKDKANKSGENKPGEIQATVLKFDPNYGYPVEIFFDNGSGTHNEERWEVKSFQILN